MKQSRKLSSGKNTSKVKKTCQDNDFKYDKNYIYIYPSIHSSTYTEQTCRVRVKRTEIHRNMQRHTNTETCRDTNTKTCTDTKTPHRDTWKEKHRIETQKHKETFA